MPEAADVLVTASEMETYLGLGAGAGGVPLQSILNGLFDTLEGKTRQTFSAGTTLTDVAHNGWGVAALWLKYPITTLTAVKVGGTAAAPHEILDPTNPDSVVIDAVRSRRIVRTDGGVFPQGYRNVFVTYAHSGTVTASAKQALRAAAAMCYRRRGSEDASSESEAGWSHSLLLALKDCPEWQDYMSRFARPVAL